MIHFEFYNFIVPIKTINEKYSGQLTYFMKDVANGTYTDDGELASVRFLHLEEINDFIDLVIRRGLHFHVMERYSTDFAICTCTGLWWKVNWLIFNIAVCFYKHVQ